MSAYSSDAPYNGPAIPACCDLRTAKLSPETKDNAKQKPRNLSLIIARPGIAC